MSLQRLWNANYNVVRACSTDSLQKSCCQPNFPKFTQGFVTDSDRISQTSVLRGSSVSVSVGGYNIWNSLMQKHCLNHDYMRTSCTVCIRVRTCVRTDAEGSIWTHTMCSKYTPQVSSMINTQTKFCFAKHRPVHNSAETATKMEFNLGTWCLYFTIVFLRNLRVGWHFVRIQLRVSVQHTSAWKDVLHERENLPKHSWKQGQKDKWTSAE